MHRQGTGLRAVSGIDVDVRGATELAAKLRTAGLKAGFHGARLVAKHGLALQQAVKRNASGRPGPRIITGDYNRSIMLELRGLDAKVFTNKVQGPRLEWGFVGTDSLGRTFNQAPLPHFAPAAAEIMPAFVADVVVLATSVMR
jgi:hypothetical protein